MRLDSILHPPRPASVAVRAATAGLLGSALLASAAAAAALEATLPDSAQAPPAQTAERAIAQTSSPLAGERLQAVPAAPPLQAAAASGARTFTGAAECGAANQNGVRECVVARPPFTGVPAGPAEAASCGPPNANGVRECVAARPGASDSLVRVTSSSGSSIVRVTSSPDARPAPTISVTSAPPQAAQQPANLQGIDITAQTSKQLPWVDGVVTVFEGDPRLRGVVGPWRSRAADVRLHHRSVEPGFDFKQLDGKIKRVDAFVPQPGSGDRPVEINITLNTPLACCIRPVVK